MESAEIDEAMRRHRLVGLDSCILIYLMEHHPVFGAAAQRIFAHVQSGRSHAVLATLALMEVMTGVYRRKDDAETADDHFSLLLEFPNARWVNLDFPIADEAARLKAEHRLSTPDAIHLATAILSGATAFFTNDREIRDIPGIEILTL
ncbi:MAG: PIN domain-containing protein [Phycisphaerae bacterium]|nr:PIN domain-containing protein [Phycisphaerae bacterium]